MMSCSATDDATTAASAVGDDCDPSVERLIEDAINKLDEPLKRYYFLAKEIVPDLVATETNAQKFVQVSQEGSIQKAALRLANYWMNRSYFFGERWLLPMTQTGRGCLSKRDLDVLRTGFCALINIGSDGRQILLNDPSLLEGVTVDFGARERILFYLATSAVSDYTRTHGFDVVFLAGPRGLSHKERYSELVTRVYASIPVRLKSLTSVPVPVMEGTERLVEYFSFMVIRSYQVASANGKKKSPIQAWDSTETAVQRLVTYGIDRKYLPLKIGGRINFDEQFNEWVRMRLSLEDVMSAALPTRNVLPDLTVADKPDRTEKGLSRIIRRAVGSTSNNMAKEDFVKKRNAMYSRRRVHKIKTQVLLLQDQKDMLETDRTHLTEENRRLKDLLAKAKAVISQTSLNCKAKKSGRASKAKSNTRPASVSQAGHDPISNHRVSLSLFSGKDIIRSPQLEVYSVPSPVYAPVAGNDNWNSAPVIINRTETNRQATMHPGCEGESFPFAGHTGASMKYVFPMDNTLPTWSPLILPEEVGDAWSPRDAIDSSTTGNKEEDESLWDLSELQDLATMEEDVSEGVGRRVSFGQMP